MNRQVSQEEINRYRARQAHYKKHGSYVWQLFKLIIWAAILAAGGWLVIEIAYWHTPAGRALENAGGNPTWDQMIHNTQAATWLFGYCGVIIGMFLMWQIAMHTHGHYVRVAARWQVAQRVPPGAMQSFKQWCILHPYGSPFVVVLLTLTGINAIRRIIK